MPWQEGLAALYQFLPNETKEVQDDVARSYNEAIQWISLAQSGKLPAKKEPAAGPIKVAPKKRPAEATLERRTCGAPGGWSPL